MTAWPGIWEVMRWARKKFFSNIKLSDWSNDSIKTVLKTEIWIWNVDWRDTKFRQTKTRGLSVSAQKNHS